MGSVKSSTNWDCTHSSELSDWLRDEKSVFVSAGDCFGMDYFFSLGIGERKGYILEGLDRIKEALNDRFNI